MTALNCLKTNNHSWKSFTGAATSIANSFDLSYLQDMPPVLAKEIPKNKKDTV